MQFLTVFVAAICFSSVTWGALLGGISSDEKTPLPNDDPVVAIIPKVSTEIRKEVAAKLVSGSNGSANDIKDAPITVLAYKSQVVAGTNYFVKARIGKFIFHLRILNDLQDNVSLSAVEGPKKESDPIVYF